MTNLPDTLAVVTLGSAIFGAGWKAVAKLTRIADAVDRLSQSMEHVVSRVGEHENRITRLEERS